jgi:hypothetical protein
MPIDFAGKGTPITAADFQAGADQLGGDVASLWSLMAVETRGFGFLADRRPQILFERHVFHARTEGAFSQDNPDISNPQPGGYAGGAAEYGRLAKAMALDELAALESASWGAGQVMGFNAAAAGFDDVTAMVTAMVGSEGAQLQAFVQFIAGQPRLNTAFRNHDWATVARLYNGPNFAANQYDTKLAQKHTQFSTAANRPDLDLRTVQACLLYLKYLVQPSDVDGVSGPRTRAAIFAFRRDRDVPGDGLDADLLNRLRVDAGI